MEPLGARFAAHVESGGQDPSSPLSNPVQRRLPTTEIDALIGLYRDGSSIDALRATVRDPPDHGHPPPRPVRSCASEGGPQDDRRVRGAGRGALRGRARHLQPWRESSGCINRPWRGSSARPERPSDSVGAGPSDCSGSMSKIPGRAGVPIRVRRGWPPSTRAIAAPVARPDQIPDAVLGGRSMEARRAFRSLARLPSRRGLRQSRPGGTCGGLGRGPRRRQPRPGTPAARRVAGRWRLRRRR